MAISRRLSDETEFTAGEIVLIAEFLDMEPGELFQSRKRPSAPRGGASRPSNIVFPDFAGDRTGAKNQGYVPKRGDAEVVPLFTEAASL